MIFITSNETPLFRAYVNGVTEKELPSGGKITTIILGTSGKNTDGTKKYSSWFVNLIGSARKENEVNPLQKGDIINVYSFKQENVSKKNEDGSFGKPFFNMSINMYEKYIQDSNPEGYAMIDGDLPY